MAQPTAVYTLEDILVDPAAQQTEYDETFIRDTNQNARKQFKKYDIPSASEIIPHWLFLGNKIDVSDKAFLQRLGITHILNVTDLPNYFTANFVYAQIKVEDAVSCDLRPYFDAATAFLDLVNPQTNAANGDHKLKVFVHCAVGKSRSASMVVQYLMRRGIDFGNAEWLQKIEEFGLIEQFVADDRLFVRSQGRCCLCWLRCCLSCTRCCGDGLSTDTETEWRSVCDIGSMSYRNAMDYLQKCRSIICPNEAFASQLAELEERLRNGISTFELCYAWKHNGVSSKRTNRRRPT